MSLLRRWLGNDSATEDPSVNDERAIRKRVHPTNLSGLAVPEFLRKNPHVVLDFWASWCRPCRAFAPVVDRASDEFAGHVAFGKVNIDHEPSLAGRWNVRSIPTLLFFRDGEIVHRLEGSAPPKELNRRIRRTFRL